MRPLHNQWALCIHVSGNPQENIHGLAYAHLLKTNPNETHCGTLTLQIQAGHESHTPLKQDPAFCHPSLCRAWTCFCLITEYSEVKQKTVKHSGKHTACEAASGAESHCCVSLLCLTSASLCCAHCCVSLLCLTAVSHCCVSLLSQMYQSHEAEQERRGGSTRENLLGE